MCRPHVLLIQVLDHIRSYEDRLRIWLIAKCIEILTHLTCTFDFVLGKVSWKECKRQGNRFLLAHDSFTRKNSTMSIGKLLWGEHFSPLTVQLQWYLTTRCKCCQKDMSLYRMDCKNDPHLLCRVSSKIRTSNDQVKLLILEDVMQGNVDASGRCSTKLNHAAYTSSCQAHSTISYNPNQRLPGQYHMVLVYDSYVRLFLGGSNSFQRALLSWTTWRSTTFGNRGDILYCFHLVAYKKPIQDAAFLLDIPTKAFQMLNEG